MIRKSGNQFSEKIMLKETTKREEINPIQSNRIVI